MPDRLGKELGTKVASETEPASIAGFAAPWATASVTTAGSGAAGGTGVPKATGDSGDPYKRPARARPLRG